MTPDLPAQYQPIAPDDRGFYAAQIAAGVPHGRAIVACWDREGARLGVAPVPPLPPSRGLAHHMRPSETAQQGPRLDSADNRGSCAIPGVSSQKTCPLPAMAAGLFGVGA